MKTEWSRIDLKEPVTMRKEGQAFIIRKLAKVKGITMCELEIDDDKVMKPLASLPENAKALIQKQLPGITL